MPYFYTLPKVHKAQRPPPWRPIISGQGSLMEPLSAFVDHFLRPIVQTMPTYLKDTTDVLRAIPEIEYNAETDYLVSFDVESLYTSIPQDETLDTIRTILSETVLDSITPVPFIMALAKLAMKENFFRYEDTIYLQTSGTTDGAKLYAADGEEKESSSVRSEVPRSREGEKPEDVISKPGGHREHKPPRRTSGEVWLTKADLLESKFLLTRDNHTNLVIRIIPGAVGFTYLTFNEGDTVPIAYKSHLYTLAEMRFSTVEKVLTAVQMAILKERALSKGKRMLVVTPYPALEAVTKASVPNSEALHPRWIQWAASLTSPDVTFIFDASLQSQEFLQYEFVHPAPMTMRPLEDFHCIIYTDGSARVAHGSKHAYVSACAIVVGTMVNDEFKSDVVHTQTLGDCTAQLAELRSLMLALEYADPSVTTPIVSDSYYCVQSYNENLFFWIQNDFRDSKGSTIKHKMIWVRVAELKEQLPLVYVIHSLGHQRLGVHSVGNSLADEAAKTAVSTYLVAAITRSKSKIDDDMLAAVGATEKGSKYPKGFPSKYSYHLSPDKVPYVKIPDVGERLIPNTDHRSTLITAAHEGVSAAHSGISATIGKCKASRLSIVHASS
ncbi:uncharacterized protein LOC144790876 [Lissotriton helveticus]